MKSFNENQSIIIHSRITIIYNVKSRFGLQILEVEETETHIHNQLESK